MTDAQIERAEYHLARRDAERRRADRAATAKARHAHLRLAQMHDLQLLFAYLPEEP